MQILDKVIWDQVLDNAAKIAYAGIPRTKEWRRKRMDKALRQAMKDLGLTVGDLP